MNRATSEVAVLMRHAEPVASVEDAARPLSVQGRRQAELMASWMVAVGVEPGEVRSSDRLRARQTAELVGRRLGLPPGRLREWNALAPDADPMVAARDLESDARCAVLVGHLPHIERLASTLAVGDPMVLRLELGYASAVVLVRSGDRWTVRTVIGPSEIQGLGHESRVGYRVST